MSSDTQSSNVVSISQDINFLKIEDAEPFNDLEFFEYFEECKPALQEGDEEKMDEIVQKMNRFMVVCNEGSNITPYWIYEDRTVLELEVRDWFPESSSKAANLFAKYNYEGPKFDLNKDRKNNARGRRTATLNIFNVWKSHRLQRSINTFTFNPRLQPGFIMKYEKNTRKLIFNRWTGFSPKILVPIAEEFRDIADERLVRILFHLKVVFSKDNEIIYHAFLNWLASVVQKPWEKTPVVPIVCGMQGAGKSMFWEQFSKIFGVHGTVVPDAGLITDKYFGSELATKVFVTVGETSFKVGSRDADILKNQVTSKTRKTEKKFQDIKIQPDYVNMAWSSNDEKRAFPAEKDINRRYFFVTCDNQRANVKTYFRALNSAFEDDELLGLRAFYNYLLKWQVPEDALRNMPHTEEKSDAVMSLLNEIETWWLKCLRASSWCSPAGARVDEERPYWVTERANKDVLMGSFLGTIKFSQREEWDALKFEVEFKKLLPAIDEDLAPHYFEESEKIFTMPRWKKCNDYFHALKGLVNPLSETVKSKKRAGEPLSNDKNKISSWVVAYQREKQN